MPDIFHNFPIKAPASQVFAAVSAPEGLNSWWTLTCAGQPKLGAEYKLGFGPGYDWLGVVTQCTPGTEFEFELTTADDDWRGTKLGFNFTEKDGVTDVHFHHTNWPGLNEHYRISCYCWAMYLRLLKRFVEAGEVVPYNDRLEV